MKIVEMRVTPVATVDPPLLNIGGMHAPYALRTIVELVTDNGISGVGEIPGGQEVTACLDAARETVVGTDPFHINALRHSIEQRFGQLQREGDMPWHMPPFVLVFSAIEVACYDIVGKACDRPVVDLLGGPARERVGFSAYLFYKPEGAGGEFGLGVDPGAQGWEAARQAEALDPDSVVCQAQAMRNHFGFRSIKLKGGVMEPQHEVEAMLALRERFGPSVPLRLDPNAAWSLETSVEYGKKLEGILEYLEDPCGGQQNMAKLRRTLKLPLATNMCTTSFDHLPQSITLHSEDIILADHHFWGGLKASVELGRICATFGRALSMHSNSHLGISLAAMTHLAAAVPVLTYDVDTHYPWQSDELIVGGRFQFEDGMLPPPRGPGLGVELDHAALERLHQNYRRCGLTRRDDQTEMQKLKPGWTYKSPRW